MELKTARRIARLTQRQLADLAGVDVSSISMVESKKRVIGAMSYQSVVRIARALNVEPDELFPVADIEPPAVAAATTETSR